MTAAALLADLRSRGVELRVDGDRILFRPPDRVPSDLRERLRARKDELLELLRRGDDPDANALLDAVRRVQRIMPGARLRTVRTPADSTDLDTGAVIYVPGVDGRLIAFPAVREPDNSPESPAAWNTEAADLIHWFREARAAGTLPVESFALTPWAQIAEPARWYASLEADIAAGPSAPRGRSGALLEDLANLRHGIEGA